MSELLKSLLFKEGDRVRVINPKFSLFGQEGYIDEFNPANDYVVVGGFYGPHYYGTFSVSDLRRVA